MMSQILSLYLILWKLKKASVIDRIDQFPYFSIKSNSSYSESPTKEYDDIAMKYVSWVCCPLMCGYAVYSFLYNEHKSLYSYCLNTLVGCIYTFGFINMTPQLYINYRLQSVEHMPSKALFYRFLNTIIDDLFSFIITMPTMHRISCFRDDIIFIIYLYQRWAYRVDKSRGRYATIAHRVAESKDGDQAEQKRIEEDKKNK